MCSNSNICNKIIKYQCIYLKYQYIYFNSPGLGVPGAKQWIVRLSSWVCWQVYRNEKSKGKEFVLVRASSCWYVYRQDDVVQQYLGSPRERSIFDVYCYYYCYTHRHRHTHRHTRTNTHKHTYTYICISIYIYVHTPPHQQKTREGVALCFYFCFAFLCAFFFWHTCRRREKASPRALGSRRERSTFGARISSAHAQIPKKKSEKSTFGARINPGKKKLERVKDGDSFDSRIHPDATETEKEGLGCRVQLCTDTRMAYAFHDTHHVTSSHACHIIIRMSRHHKHTHIHIRRHSSYHIITRMSHHHKHVTSAPAH